MIKLSEFANRLSIALLKSQKKNLKKYIKKYVDRDGDIVRIDSIKNDTVVFFDENDKLNKMPVDEFFSKLVRVVE